MPFVYTHIDPRWIGYREPIAVVAQKSAATVPDVEQYVEFWTSPFGRTLSALLALNKLEDSAGYVFKPSDRAFNRAMNFAWVVRERLKQLPLPKVIPDGEEGIDLRWKLGNRMVNLSCKANGNQRDFIYWKEGQGRYDGIEASIPSLRERLRWLQNAA